MPPQRRARRFFRLLNRRGVDVALVQESGKWAKRQARQRPNWRRAYADPSWRRAGNHKANGVLAKNIRVIDRTQIGPEDRRVAVALCRTEQGFTFVALSAHAPTRRDDPTNERRAMLQLDLWDYVKHLGDVPVIVGIDANAGRYTIGYLRVAHKHGVDYLLHSPHFHLGARDILHRPRLSDHDFVLADLLPVAQGKRLDKLPRWDA